MVFFALKYSPHFAYSLNFIVISSRSLFHLSIMTWSSANYKVKIDVLFTSSPIPLQRLRFLMPLGCRIKKVLGRYNILSESNAYYKTFNYLWITLIYTSDWPWSPWIALIIISFRHILFVTLFKFAIEALSYTSVRSAPSVVERFCVQIWLTGNARFNPRSRLST